MSGWRLRGPGSVLKYSMKSIILAGLSLLILAPPLMAYESAFAQTQPGVTELKTLPAGRLLEASGTGSYFDQANRLFRPLFRYIQAKDIAMTVPVEARIEPGTMYFWVAESQLEKADGDMEGVRVIDVPVRRVAAHGARGAYSEANFLKAKEELLQWLQQQGGLRVVGEPYAVYWNGPFTLWFLKEFEVQVEIAAVDGP